MMDCPKCGAELTDYYNSIFELNVRGNIWCDVPVRQADCTNCDEQILTPISEQLIDDLKTGKRAVEPYGYVDMLVGAVLQHISNHGEPPNSFWDVIIEHDTSNVPLEEWKQGRDDLLFCETCKQLMWELHRKLITGGKMSQYNFGD